MKRLTASPCLLPLLCIYCLLLAGCGSMQTMRTPTPVPLGLPTKSPASGELLAHGRLAHRPPGRTRHGRGEAGTNAGRGRQCRSSACSASW